MSTWGDVMTPRLPRVRCPRCRTGLSGSSAEDESPRLCPSCGWRGLARGFDPVPLSVEVAGEAMDDDATCVHHPRKQAVATCAGTGDFICALCSVTIDGRDYSTAYLDAGGKTLAAEAFATKLERPDSEVVVYLALCFVPFFCGCWWVAAPVWVVLSALRLTKAQRMRRESPLFARVCGTGRLATLWVLLVLFGGGSVAMVVLYALTLMQGVY